MDVLQSFVGAAVLVGMGWALLRWRVLPEASESVLAAFSFSVAIPALLFVALVEADLSVVLVGLFPGIALSAVLATLVYAGYAAVRRRPLGTATVGALGAAFVNGGSLGIPIAEYLLGDAAYAVPLILFQMVIHVPIALGILDIASASRDDGESAWRRWLKPVRNPIVLAAALGLLVNLSDVELWPSVLRPMELLADTMIPVGLLVFGMSLRGITLSKQMLTADTIVASVCKLVVHPLAALGVGLLLGLPQWSVYALVVIAAIPTGQNLYIYASMYRTAVDTARDTTVLTTALSVPLLLHIAHFFAPS